MARIGGLRSTHIDQESLAVGDRVTRYTRYGFDVLVGTVFRISENWVWVFWDGAELPELYSRDRLSIFCARVAS